MRFVFDHDLHIHSFLSLCSGEPKQTPQRILQYAQEFHLNTICLTDHFWDEAFPVQDDFYSPQNYAHICQSKPLPQADGVRFLFGCEAEVDKNNELKVSKKVMDELDFIVIPTTHFHMRGLTINKVEALTHKGMAKNWIERFDHVLDMDLPFYKIGIAHLTCSAIGPDKEHLVKTIEAIPKAEMQRLFSKAAKKGVGIEINRDDFDFHPNSKEATLEVYRVAKDCGCKFYLGSDAHRPIKLDESKAILEEAIDLLELEEEDKIDFIRDYNKGL